MNTNAKVLAVGGVLILLWAVLTGAAIAWRLFFMWGLLIILLHLMLQYWAANLSCSVELITKGASHEGHFEITYVFANNGLIPIPWCQVRIHLDKELGSLSFAPEAMSFSVSEIKAIRKQFQCPKRGVYSLGGVTVMFQDLLDLRGKLTHYDKQMIVEVFPHKYPVESLLRSGRDEGGALRGNWSAEQDYTSISRIREALPQESTRHVHWKASARTEELQIREYEARRRFGITIVLDSCAAKYAEDKDGQIEERCVEVAAGLVSHWISHGFEVNLATGAGVLLRLKGVDSLDTAMRALMVFRPLDPDPLDHVLSGLLAGRNRGSDFQVVTPGLSVKEAFSVLKALPGTASVFQVGEDPVAVFESLPIVRIPI